MKSVRKGKSTGALILAAVSAAVITGSFGLAQPEKLTLPSEEYIPHLGEIMSAIQARHVKLWYAGKAGNWDLATFELRQLKANLVDAARLYAGIPVSNVTTMAVPMRSLEDAMAAKDIRSFSKAYSGVTEACNGCHVSLGRSFIVIHTPTEQQPLGDQSFSPPRKP